MTNQDSLKLLAEILLPLKEIILLLQTMLVMLRMIIYFILQFLLNYSELLKQNLNCKYKLVTSQQLVTILLVTILISSQPVVFPLLLLMKVVMNLQFKDWVCPIQLIMFNQLNMLSHYANQHLSVILKSNAR